MFTTDIAKACEEWAAEAAGLNSSFDYPPESLNKALPLVIAEVQRKVRNSRPPNFPNRVFQHTTLRIWTVELTLLVSPDPAWTASQSLYTQIDSLEDALFQDATLGGRVAFAETEVDASFDPPEVEFTDGTVARQATFLMTVGELVETK